MKSIAVCLLFLMMSFSSLACDLALPIGSEERFELSSEFTTNNELCSPYFYGDTLTTKHLFKLKLFPEKNKVGDYWSQWGVKTDSDPFFTEKFAQSYLGIGVWMPSELQEEQDQMTTGQWLRSHGVLLSLGFGDQANGEPRVRMDYRWHEDYDADFMMLLEVPF